MMIAMIWHNYCANLRITIKPKGMSLGLFYGFDHHQTDPVENNK